MEMIVFVINFITSSLLIKCLERKEIVSGLRKEREIRDVLKKGE